jgi:Delta7-sterol 5-desaturase
MRAAIGAILWALLCLLLPLCAWSAAGGGSGDTVFGEWATQGMSAKVAVGHCPNRLDRVCGTITWLWEPADSSGSPKTDAENPDPHLRRRPLLGAEILSGFRATSTGTLDSGTIYNPEDGHTYDASLRLQGADTLIVEGCVLFICRRQVWRRASSVCAARP